MHLNLETNIISTVMQIQENFNPITSLIQDSADKHIPSKTCRSVSSVPWITSELRKTSRRRNKTHAKAKKTGSKKRRSKLKLWKEKLRMILRSSTNCM